MNSKEKELVSHLKKMREQYGVAGVKAEFEAEGTTFEELLRLQEIASQAGLRIALKIGGPEDVWGIKQARRIGVSDIVAPMVESAYGVSKFLEAFKKHVPEEERADVASAINIETKQAHEDLDNIMAVGREHGLQCVTVGRVDLVGSMGMKRDAIDSETVFDITKRICEKAKESGMRATMGGGVERGSLPFITRLAGLGVLDRFETRKIIFPVKPALASYLEAIKDAHRFELGWLENKRAHHSLISDEDAHRIPMLQKRIQD